MTMDQKTKDRIVDYAIRARKMLEEGKFDGYNEALNKLWNEIDGYWHREFQVAEGREVLEIPDA